MLREQSRHDQGTSSPPHYRVTTTCPPTSWSLSRAVQKKRKRKNPELLVGTQRGSRYAPQASGSSTPKQSQGTWLCSPDGPVPLLRGQLAGSLLFLLQTPAGLLQLGQRVRGRVGWHCGVLNEEMRGLDRVPELSANPRMHSPRTLNGQGPGALVNLLLLCPRRPLGAREQMLAKPETSEAM